MAFPSFSLSCTSRSESCAEAQQGPAQPPRAAPREQAALLAQCNRPRTNLFIFLRTAPRYSVISRVMGM